MPATPLARLSRAFDSQVIVVDNASTDGSTEAVTRLYPEATLIRNTVNKGYAGATNQGIAVARGEYLLLLNNDTEIRLGAISYLADFMDRNPDVGVASCHTIYPDGGLQYPGAASPESVRHCSTGSASADSSPAASEPVSCGEATGTTGKMLSSTGSSVRR